MTNRSTTASIVCRSVFFSRIGSGLPELDDFAIDPDPDKPFPLHLFDHIAEFALLVLEERREQDDLGFCRIGENLIDDLLRRLPMDWLTCRGIVRLAHGRKEDAQIVENLGRGRDRGSWVRPCAPLLDRNRRAKALR